jgi:hypothetical protein
MEGAGAGVYVFQQFLITSHGLVEFIRMSRSWCLFNSTVSPYVQWFGCIYSKGAGSGVYVIQQFLMTSRGLVEFTGIGADAVVYICN